MPTAACTDSNAQSGSHWHVRDSHGTLIRPVDVPTWHFLMAFLLFKVKLVKYTPDEEGAPQLK